MYSSIWLKASQIVHICYMVLICKGPTSFYETTLVNQKSWSLGASLKETFADMKNWVITESLDTYFYSNKISQQKQLFLWPQSTKKQIWHLFKFVWLFPSLQIFCQKYKNQIGTMIYLHRLSILLCFFNFA